MNDATTELTEFLHEQLAADERDPGGVPDSWAATQVTSKRGLITLLLDTTHTVCEDPWYTCGAATKEREGERCPDETRRGTCDCGRDGLVLAGLKLLALPYVDRPGCRPEWAPGA
ncbi:DUF6221 family protein [Kitasatospora sp. NPDC092948]|uniref:DUF6221 family protein n=1 Tax=Kitasatospora sp. NPDC092948 TaxID=3364088 RepID=UPI0037F4691D